MLKRSRRSFDRSLFGVDFDSTLVRCDDDDDDDDVDVDVDDEDDGLSKNVTVLDSERCDDDSVDR